MPYVKQLRRIQLDEIVELMYENGVRADGDLNYILYAYCKRHVEPSYNNYKNYRAELRECADWIGERLLKPYELKKREENGDV
jgi:hypothetical protein